jgi:Ca2+:H+ antiporter
VNLKWLLVFVPIGLGLDWFGASPMLVFLASALSIIPLAGLMGDATEALARFLGPTVGGLLNATLGNAPEIIISGFALRAGLVDMVKSSLTGSNFGLIIPAMTQFSASASRSISRETAVVLFVVYLVSLVAIFVNQRALIGKEAVKANLKEQHERPDECSDEDEDEVNWSRNKALAILAAVTICLAIMSEVLTGAIEPASESLHLSPRFAGVFLLALVGNAAELITAVRFARKDQMDLCVAVTVGASVQVGLLVAPVMVFLGMLLGQNMDLIFSPLELISIVMAIYLTRNLTDDGESSWLEGVMLIAVYLLFGIGFLYHPNTATPKLSILPPAAEAKP